MAEIIESKHAQKELAKAPKEVVVAYEIWARLIEVHGHNILRAFKGYYDEALRGKMDTAHRGLIASGELFIDFPAMEIWKS